MQRSDFWEVVGICSATDAVWNPPAAFNAADIVVVGKFSGSHALAAVGSTGALINLFVNVFIGFSIGTNVLVAQYFGARDEKNVHETVHTSILLGIVGGFILIVAGMVFAKPMLEWMDTPEDVLSHAVLYMRIYFIGMPAMLVYNFGAAILRAIGDTGKGAVLSSQRRYDQCDFKSVFCDRIGYGSGGCCHCDRDLSDSFCDFDRALSDA